MPTGYSANEAACSTRATISSGQRRCRRGQHRAHQHDDEHDQQDALLAVQVGQPSDQRRRRGGGEQIRGDRPTDGHSGRVQLVGDDAEHRNHGGLQDGDGQDDHAQSGDQRARPSKRLIEDVKERVGSVSTTRAPIVSPSSVPPIMSGARRAERRRGRMDP